MRFARIAFGLLLALAGLLVTVVGGVAAFWLVGPDNTVDTGERSMPSLGLAVMTAPDLIDRHGPTLHVTASAAKPVFVGVGQDLDVSSYLRGSQYTRIVRFDLPSRLDTQWMKGEPAALNPPAGLDWWTVKANGAGEQSIAWPIVDGPYSVVVMNADGSPVVDAKVTFGIELDGAFGTCLLVFGAGVVLLAVGLLLMFVRRRTRPLPPVPVVAPLMPYSPPAPQQHTQVRRAAGLATALLLVATGCAAIPPKNTSQQVSTRPAVTLADGQAVIKKYNELNNKANLTRDAKLSETIEGDPTLAQTRAGYQIDRKLDPDGKDKAKPFTYTEPEIGAPRFGAYPMRFVASTGVSDDTSGGRHLGVWERQTAGTPWLLTHSVYPPAGMPLPPMEGLRMPTKAEMTRLPILPQAAGNNLAAYLSGGLRAKQAALFIPSPGTVKLLTQREKTKADETKKAYISTVVDTFRVSGQPLTFMASNGDALVFLTFTEQLLENIEPGSNAYWTTGSVTAFSSMVKYNQSLHMDYLHQVAITIPKAGKPRVLSMDTQLVGAGGS
ncbi:hypothetical protein [Kribbella catacumbae]|uniref:hypothetical protein n=1 Tax=Kribbella catacumbae TaxID=460086 RepID=UPI0003A2F31A|nr:hypothetical protein [Kribbella catacumbae]